MLIVQEQSRRQELKKYHFLEQVRQNVVQSFSSNGVMKLIKSLRSSHSYLGEWINQGTADSGHQRIHILHHLWP